MISAHFRLECGPRIETDADDLVVCDVLFGGLVTWRLNINPGPLNLHPKPYTLHPTP